MDISKISSFSPSWRIISPSLLLAFVSTPLLAAPLDLSDLSLEDLMHMEVTTVSRKAEPLVETAAAVFVITSDDIRRSGAMSIPEALRLAPGVQVAKINANNWAISIRGYNDRFSNQLLVLMDGRSVYNPLHSGVTWEIQDMVLEDIDRIEVIRGPGAAMWGANAVNGVINIISKNAKDTQGALVSVAVGSQEKINTSARFGATYGDSTSYRLYVKQTLVEEGLAPEGFEANDSWYKSQGGFRVDHTLADQNTVTVQGDLYRAKIDGTVVRFFPFPPFSATVEDQGTMNGGNILGLWQYTDTSGSAYKLQTYFDRNRQIIPFGSENRDTYDIDFQNLFQANEMQSFTWGLSFRYTRDTIDGTWQVDTDPVKRDDLLYSAFIQDEVQLTSRFKLQLGAKFEHNDYTGFECQPNIRAIWNASESHYLWGAVSRAVRTPSRYEHDGAINGIVPPSQQSNMLPLLRSWEGNDNFVSEELIAYETGYRWLLDKGTVDVALFVNDYDKLHTAEPYFVSQEVIYGQSVLVQKNIYANDMSGYTYGGELAVDWKAADWWRLQGNYTWLQIDLALGDNSRDYSSYEMETTSPSQRLSFRSSMDFPHNFTLDLWLRYTDELVSENTPDYWEADAQVSWSNADGLTIALVGQNLLNSSHKEMEQDNYLTLYTETERSGYLKLTWGY